MTNEEQKLREFADKWGIREDDEPTFDPHTENPYYGYSRRTKQCLSDLTALISEHYTANEEVDKMVEEKLREELIAYVKWYGSFSYENLTDEMLVDEYLKSREK